MSVSVEPRDLTYPDKPDANGYAKKYYKRRAFYFGMHNTPESFTLFGEWKRQLMETGEAPEVKAIRRDLAHTERTSQQPTDERRSYVPVLIGAAIVSASILIATQMVRSNQVPMVDGVALTPDEIGVVRGQRMLQKISDERRKSESDRFVRQADIRAKVMANAPHLKQSPDAGKLHTSGGLKETLKTK